MTTSEVLAVVAATVVTMLVAALAVVLVSLAVQSLGVILPLGFLAGIAWFVTRRLRVEKQRTA